MGTCIATFRSPLNIYTADSGLWTHFLLLPSLRSLQDVWPRTVLLRLSSCNLNLIYPPNILHTHIHTLHSSVNAHIQKCTHAVMFIFTCALLYHTRPTFYCRRWKQNSNTNTKHWCPKQTITISRLNFQPSPMFYKLYIGCRNYRTLWVTSDWCMTSLPVT